MADCMFPMPPHIARFHGCKLNERFLCSRKKLDSNNLVAVSIVICLKAPGSC